MNIERRFSFFIFQLAEKMNDPKIHAFRLPQIYLRLVITCFKLRSLSMETLKTVLRALFSYEKKHVLCEPKSKSFSVFKEIIFENHIKACVYFCVKRYLVEHNS